VLSDEEIERHVEAVQVRTMETGFLALSLLIGAPPREWTRWTGHPWDIDPVLKDAVLKCFTTWQVVWNSPGRIARLYACWYYEQEEQKCKNNTGSG
jgi:hypothetical protein